MLLEKCKMETEVRVLKQDLVRTQEALRAATKKCRDLVRELDNRNSNQASERNFRDQQLSRILRALLVLESRLKQEQKSIRQLLCEKDNVIRNQQLEIAKLRRYTKNYIKGKRDLSLGQSINVEESIPTEKNLSNFQVDEYNGKQDSSLSKDIENLKCEIITKLNGSNAQEIHDDHSRGITKTHSFAGSDISKTSLTSSENTDASIITTTTEGSPSLLSTEGFCEGESTDVSPGSTLNKSSRCTPTTVTDSENETMTILDDDETMMNDEGNRFSNRRFGVLRGKPLKIGSSRIHELPKIIRTESTDDGMDSNFVSDEEERQEPIYVNSCTENNVRNLQGAIRTNEDCSNNNINLISKIEPEEQNQEDTSGNWYSDPDEDRISDDVFRHTTYRPNGNHNSVLECVNQILLRDMEEDEKVLSIPRRFKHRGKIVRFQPARLSDIESVGSEMERRNSEETPIDSEVPNEIEPSENDTESIAFGPTTSEDEYGMRIEESSSSSSSTQLIVNTIEPELSIDGNEKPRPIVIIEPKIEHEENQKKQLSFVLPQKVKGSPNLSPTLKMERIEEKTCLQMSSKGLTLAKNLDYEDIESLPDVISSPPPPPKTPPALPPKPQFINNTLVLKKIPSPSFLIDETRKKTVLDVEQGKNLFPFSSPIKTTSVKSLKFDDDSSGSESSLWKNRFNNVRSSFKSKHSPSNKDEPRKIPRVTNIVRHFEEFKIGGENEERLTDRIKPRERHVLVSQFNEDFDIRQNFEEFNLDDCDLSDDPDRPEGDGSETLTTVGIISGQTENTLRNKDNNNIVIPIDNANNGYDHFLEATGLSTKSILTPSRLLSNHKSMLKPKDIKYKNMIKSNAVLEKHGPNHTHVRHWTGPFV